MNEQDHTARVGAPVVSKTALLAALVVALLAPSAAAAMADTFGGTGGNDRATARGGNDRTDGDLGRDAAQGASGDDFPKLERDENSDDAFCGAGYDTVRVSANDFIGDDTRAGDLDIIDPANAVLGCGKIVINCMVVVQVPIPIP